MNDRNGSTPALHDNADAATRATALIPKTDREIGLNILPGKVRHMPAGKSHAYCHEPTIRGWQPLLLHGDGFRQVAGLVDVGTLQYRDVVGK